MPRFNVEGYVRSHLAFSLYGRAEVRVSVPDPRPRNLVVVERSGGSADRALLDRPGVHLLVWAPTKAEAFELAEACADAMAALRSDAHFAAGVADVSEESFRYDPDPETGDSPRYFLSYTLTTYRY